MSPTPAETAAMDQGQAAARDEVYTYVETARAMAAKVGTQQSTSNLYVLLGSHATSRALGEEGLRVLLAEAIHMLAEAGVRAPWVLAPGHTGGSDCCTYGCPEVSDAG